MDPKLSSLQSKLLDAANTLKALAHPIRLDIVISLENYEMNVTSLFETLDVPQAKLSKHLAILHTAQIISLRREGRNHFYKLKNPELANQLTSLISDRL